MPRIVRGNRIIEVPEAEIPADPVWTTEDHARYLTFRGRGVPAELAQCLVWKRRVPGLQYPTAIETAAAAACGL